MAKKILNVLYFKWLLISNLKTNIQKNCGGGGGVKYSYVFEEQSQLKFTPKHLRTKEHVFMFLKEV